MTSSNTNNDNFDAKFDLHYRQQLSALMDGDLPPDEARFLLRRLQHDEELNACWERWQLCADVLRGQGQAPAPAGFAQRVAVAVSAEYAQQQAAANAGSSRARGLVRWGGGALAASVAAMALFLVRQQSPEESAAPAVAAQAAPAAAPAQESLPPPVEEARVAPPAAAVAVASVPRRPDAAPRRSATRTQQAARVAAATPAPQRATGTTDASPALPPLPDTVMAASVDSGLAAAAQSAGDPFSTVGVDVPAQHVPAARPWPRAVLPQYPASGGFSASYPGGSAAQTFYPFEPRLPATPPIRLPDAGADADSPQD